MLKKFLSRTAMIMSVAVLSTAFTSCSDEEDEPKPEPTPEIVEMVVTYEAQIAPDMLNYLDVTVDFTGNNNEPTSASVEGETWSQSVTFKGDQLPTDLNIDLNIAKKQNPVFEGDGVHLEGFVNITAKTTLSDGSTVDNSQIGQILKTPHKISFSADRLDEYISKHNGIFTQYNVSGIEYDATGRITKWESSL